MFGQGDEFLVESVVDGETGAVGEQHECLHLVLEPETSYLHSPLLGLEIHHIQVKNDLMPLPSLFQHPNKERLHDLLHGHKFFQVTIRARHQSLNGISLLQIEFPPLHALDMEVQTAMNTLEHEVLFGLHHGAGFAAEADLAGGEVEDFVRVGVEGAVGVE